MTDNGRTIAATYEAFGKGDVPSVMAQLADRLEWIETDAADIPTRGTWHTPQEVLEHVFAAVPEYFESFELRPELWVESGDDVVVTGRGIATTRNDAPLNAP